MKLSRIRIEQFRQFRRSIEFKDLEPGINLFVGPNEAGKSTIATAIRSAFFERYRSGSVEDLRPWDDSSASPTIELDFVIGVQAYRLVKSFLGKKRCELSIGSRRLDGAEEDRTRFDVGYGLVAGHNERKAIAMANLDIALHRTGGHGPLEQSVLMTTDGLDASGFLEHLKLPHYVTFRSMIERKQAMRTDRARNQRKGRHNLETQEVGA